MNTTKYDILGRMEERGCLELLAADGIDVTADIADSLSAHLDLVREWNPFASLVSPRDVGRLVDAHIVDSVSLAPVIVRQGGTVGTLLDIGSGGGFPALPLKLLLPGLDLVLVERSGRKAAFLRKVVAALNLSDVRVRHGSFPECVEGDTGDVITARAVEKARAMLADILATLRPDSVFLCQSGDPAAVVGPGFHVERVEDEWEWRGLRRGELHLVSRVPEVGAS